MKNNANAIFLKTRLTPMSCVQKCDVLMIADDSSAPFT